MMTELKDCVSGSLELLSGAETDGSGGCAGSETGIARCEVCGEPKQMWLDWPPDENGVRSRRLVYVTCSCDAKKQEEQERRDEKARFKARLSGLRAAVSGGRYRGGDTGFEKDDSPSSPVSVTCRRYAENWEQMLARNMGVLFYGSRGTGKTFYASCIVNALAEKGVTSAMVSASTLIRVLSDSRRSWDAMDALARIKLLAIDDLDAERDTTFASERMYEVINNRLTDRLPTIITTNLDAADMDEETDRYRSRIYDRIKEMCPVKLRMTGGSRRAAIAEERRKAARAILLTGVKKG